MKPRGNSTGLVSRMDGPGVAILSGNRHEVCHLNPQGDVEGAYFDLPMPVKVEHVRKAALETWNLWYEWQNASQTMPVYRGGHLLGFGQDKTPTTEPRVKGPFVVPEYDRLDMARYYILCRWKRRTPLIVTLDEAEELSQTEMPEDADMYGEFFTNLSNLGADPNLERMARYNARDLPEIARTEREFQGRPLKKGA